MDPSPVGPARTNSGGGSRGPGSALSRRIAAVPGGGAPDPVPVAADV